MKNQLLNDFQLYRFVWSGQSTPEGIVILRSAAVVGLTGLSVPYPLNR